MQKDAQVRAYIFTLQVEQEYEMAFRWVESRWASIKVCRSRPLSGENICIIIRPIYMPYYAHIYVRQHYYVAYYFAAVLLVVHVHQGINLICI